MNKITLSSRHTSFEIRALSVWIRARYLLITEAYHHIKSLGVWGRKYLFFLYLNASHLIFTAIKLCINSNFEHVNISYQPRCFITSHNDVPELIPVTNSYNLRSHSPLQRIIYRFLKARNFHLRELGKAWMFFQGCVVSNVSRQTLPVLYNHNDTVLPYLSEYFIHPVLVQPWPNVADVGPTLKQHWVMWHPPCVSHCTGDVQNCRLLPDGSAHKTDCVLFPTDQSKQHSLEYNTSFGVKGSYPPFYAVADTTLWIWINHRQCSFNPVTGNF